MSREKRKQLYDLSLKRKKIDKELDECLYEIVHTRLPSEELNKKLELLKTEYNNVSRDILNLLDESSKKT